MYYTIVSRGERLNRNGKTPLLIQSGDVLWQYRDNESIYTGSDRVYGSELQYYLYPLQ